MWTTPNMNCPKRQTDMREGTILIKGTIVGFLIIGLSWMKLFFSPDDDQKNEFPVLRPVESKRSFYCPDCRGVFMTSESKIYK